MRYGREGSSSSKSQHSIHTSKLFKSSVKQCWANKNELQPLPRTWPLFSREKIKKSNKDSLLLLPSIWPQWLWSLALAGDERGHASATDVTRGRLCLRRCILPSGERKGDPHQSSWAMQTPTPLIRESQSVLPPTVDTWKSPKTLRLELEQAVPPRKSSDSWTLVYQQLPPPLRLHPAPVSPSWSKSTNCR